MKKVLSNFISISRNMAFLFMLFVACQTYGQQRFLAEHPRLLFTKAEEPAMKKLVKNNPEAHELADFLKSKADSLASIPQKEYQMDKYGNMLWTSRAYVQRLGTLALAYRLYGEKKYLDAANSALLWVCSYPDWDPKHYLDTAEMATAVAIAYDWLYDDLPQATKEIAKRCLYERAIVLVLREYEKGSSGSWAKRETNWNVVCNAGMTMAALAIAEDYPQEAATILDNAAKYMPNCLKHFAPDGVCYEGPAYWGYTTSYLSIYLKAVADNDSGKGGIAQLPGIEKTALYSKRTLTPSGRIFNFANAGKDPQNTPAFFFFSKYYRQAEIADWYREELKKIIRHDMPLNQLFFLSLPWFDTASAGKADFIPALEVYHNTINDIIVFNGNKKKKGSLFLIAKGGEPMQAHQQLDGGTFIVESDGVCWTEDLGADDYALPGFWDGKPHGQRWKYFRNNNLSHNTLSIDHKIQHSAGEAFVCEEHPDIPQPYVKLNMSTLYKDQATSVFRKFTLWDDRTMEVEDEVALVNPQSVVSWIASTRAEVEVDGNKVHLTRNGKHFYMEIVAPAGAVFKTYAARNTYEGEYPIEGITMMEAECKLEGGKGKIIIKMSSKTNSVKAQTSSTLEMRYITSDTKANGETDFHGETEWMNQEQRIDFLDKYAAFASSFWKNPQLDQPLLNKGEAQKRLKEIKPQPLTNVRRTLRLNDWAAYGWQPGKAKESQQQQALWTTIKGASIVNGKLRLSDCTIEKEVGKVDWRFRYKMTLAEVGPEYVLSFNKGGNSVMTVKLSGGTVQAVSGNHHQKQTFKAMPVTHIEVYGDFTYHRFFVTVNGGAALECAIDNSLPQEVDHVSLSSQHGVTTIEDLLLFGFIENSGNRHTPFRSSLLLDEDFEEVLPMEGWQNPAFNDARWKRVNLPSVHGGFREKEEGYYLRKKVKIADFGRAVLKLETLDPGGEVWVNGQPVAVINNRHPYDLDVTDYLVPNSENLIAVRVKPYKAKNQMLHSPSDPYTGWQLGRTELILTNRCMIKGVYPHTVSIEPNRAIQNQQIVLQYSGIYALKGSVTVNYYPWYPQEGEKVASIEQPVEVRPAIDNKIRITLPIEQPELWETGSPKLYKVEVILKDETGKAIDDYVLTTGIRTIGQGNGNLYVNNRPEMLNGAQILGYRYPVETMAKTNRCVPDETVIGDLMMIKKMSGNMLRIHVHAEKDTIDGINDPRYAEYADQMGVYLLWQTAGWVREGEAWNVDFEGYPKYMRQVYNHPSIVMWEASNHPNRFKKHSIADSHDYMNQIYKTISTADSSRLISPTSFWQHTHYGNYDGSLDYKNNKITPNPVLMEPLMTRGNQDAYTGYGAKWTSLRKAPYSWAASCLAANDKAFFNFEHEESAAQPNWELAKKEPWYKVQSYEWEYEEGSIGRMLEAGEWRTSQAFQAFSAWESMKKQMLLGYDGFSWCSLESGANMFTYQKPLVDQLGIPKLAYYANKQVFSRIWAASDNVDVVYGPTDLITPVIFNLEEACTVNLNIELKNEKGKTVESKKIKNIHVKEGRSVTTLDSFRFKEQKDGCYFIVYNVTKQNK